MLQTVLVWLHFEERCMELKVVITAEVASVIHSAARSIAKSGTANVLKFLMQKRTVYIRCPSGPRVTFMLQYCKR